MVVITLKTILDEKVGYCCRPLGLGSEPINEKKLFFLKFRLFSCFAVDFILRSLLLTHIGIVILTNKKYFLHHALLFSL